MRQTPVVAGAFGDSDRTFGRKNHPSYAEQTPDASREPSYSAHYVSPSAQAMGAASQNELERLRLELNAVRREAQREREAYDLDRSKLEADNATLRSNLSSLQSSVDNLTLQRNRESKDRTDGARQTEDLRSENARLRRELSGALDSRLSHLRTPQVSFDQYKELLAICEQYAELLRTGGQLQNQVTDPLIGHRDWISRSGGGNKERDINLGKISPNDLPPLATQQSSLPDFGGVPSTGASNYDPTLQPDRPVPMSSRGSARGAPSPARSSEPDSAPVAKEVIVEGGKLLKLVQDAHPNPGKLWSFHNTTTDLQFVLEFTFGPQSDVFPLGDTEVDSRRYRISLYPGETKNFIRGVINGYKMSIRYGPPDEQYTPPSSLTDQELMPIVERVRSMNSSSTEECLRMCVAQGIPFVDQDFPPLSRSMARPFEPAAPSVQWERPIKFLPVGEKEELCVSGFDMQGPVLGMIADAWIVSALTALAPRRTDILRLFAESKQAEQVSGLYRISLNKGGVWKQFCVDNFLPCDPKTGDPFGIRCRTLRDLWASLVEKAFAKAHGSYASLQYGDPLEALQDLTGSPLDRFDWKAKETAVFSQMIRACNANKSNLVILMSSAETGNRQQQTPSEHTEVASTMGDRRIETIGLKQGHAYAVLTCVQAEGFRLCLVANPHGTSNQWSGAWSDKSEMWLRHPQVKEACNLAIGGIGIAGTMWMEWRDVAFYFDGAGVLLNRPTWLDVRIPTKFFGTKPMWIMEVSVTRPTTLFLGLHQRDRRGLESNSPERTYSAFLLTVVGCSDSGVWDAVAQSHGGTFWRGRDVHLEVQLTPNDHAYYVVPRRYSADGPKDVVFSLQAEDRHAVSVALRQPTDEVMNAVRYSPVWKFDPLPCASLSPQVECQIDRLPSEVVSW